MSFKGQVTEQTTLKWSIARSWTKDHMIVKLLRDYLEEQRYLENTTEDPLRVKTVLERFTVLFLYLSKKVYI